MYFGFVVPLMWHKPSDLFPNLTTTLTVGGQGDSRHGVHAGLRDVLEVHRDVPGRKEKKNTTILIKSKTQFAHVFQNRHRSLADDTKHPGACHTHTQPHHHHHRISMSPLAPEHGTIL